MLVLTSTLPRSDNDATPGFVLDLAKGLTAQFRITILAPHAPGAPVQECVDGVQILRFRYLPECWETLAYGGGITENLRRNRWLYLSVPFFLAAQIIAITRLLRRHNIHAIHAHWWLPQGLSAVVAKLLTGSQKPVVCTLHGADVFAFGKGAMRRLMRWVLNRCQAICPVSTAVRDALPENFIQDPRTQIAPMGVNLETQFRPVPGVVRLPTQIIFVGRLVAKKGVEWLIRAFAGVLEKNPAAQLLIVGDGPQRSELEQITQTLNLSNQIVFRGAVPHSDLPALYSAAAIAVVPSVQAPGGDREGLGLVAIEAQGCGCALIVSDAPAFRDVVIDNKNGLVVQQKNTSALANALVQLLSRKELCAELATNGREAMMRRYNHRETANRYTALLSLKKISM